MGRINNFGQIGDFYFEEGSIIKLIEVNRVEIGVSKSHSTWLFKNGNKTYAYREGANDEVILWLPLIERSFQDFTYILSNALNDAIIDQKDKETLLKSFPVNQILNTALKSNSPYWVNLALSWCDDLDNLKPLAGILDGISKNKRYSQKIRHHCLHLIAKVR